MEIEIAEKGSAAYRAGRRLDALLAGGSGKDILLMLSGGSALTILDEVSPMRFQSKLTITVLDERYTPNQLERNYCLMLATPFGQRARERGAQFIDPYVDDCAGVIEMAQRFEQEIREWVEKHPNGTIAATMGMGADGHTAGILPFPEDPDHFEQLYNNGAKWVVGFEVSSVRNPHTKRITVTLPFLRYQVALALVYAVGEEKRSALERVIAFEGTLPETPVRVIRDMEEIILVTDVPINRS